jgi:hypothetical protein
LTTDGADFTDDRNPRSRLIREICEIRGSTFPAVGERRLAAAPPRCVLCGSAFSMTFSPGMRLESLPKEISG